MKVRCLVTAATLALLTAGCQDEQPAVSLEQAKQTTAKFEGASFTPPPRTIRDITAVLERDKPDPAKVAALKAQAEVKIPEGDAPRRASALLERAKAAYELGLVRQSRRDGEEALRLAREAEMDPHDMLRHLRLIATLTGSIGELTRVSEDIIKNSLDRRQGRLFMPYSMLAYNLATTGDELGARRNIRAARDLLTEALSWQRGRAILEWGDIWESSVLVGEAGIEMSLGRNAEAETLIRRSIAQLERWLASPVGLEVNRSGRMSGIPNIYRGGPLVDVLVRRGKLAEAEAMSRQSLSTALKQDGRYHPGTAFIMTSFARVIIEQGRLDEGESLARATLETYEAIGATADSWRAADARALLADVLAVQGRWSDALAVFNQMESGFANDTDGRRRFVENRPTRALALLMSGKTTQARLAFQTLLTKRETDLGPRHYATAELKGLHALALAATGQQHAALAQFQAAVPVLLQRSRQVEKGMAGDVTAVRDQRQQLIFNGYIDALAKAPGEAHKAEAFRIADVARSRAVQGALAASGARAAARDPSLADLARREQDAQSQIGALYGALTTQYDLPPADRNAGVINRLRVQIDNLRAARAALAEEIERRFPEYAELINPKPSTVEKVQAALHPGEALIATYVTDKKTYVWAVPESGKVAFTASALGRDRIAATVRQLRRSLDPQAATLGDIPAFDVGLSHRLYSALLEPVKAGWGNAGNLLVVAHDVLGQLPFSVLVTARTSLPAESGALFSNYKKIPWLARKHAVTVLPSVTSLASLRALPAANPARRSFVGFGDPYFNVDQAASASVPKPVEMAALQNRGAFNVRGIPVSLRAAPKTTEVASANISVLPRLPDTFDEVRSIALALNADLTRDVFTGRKASEGAVKSANLSGYKVVAFATHGLVPGDLDGLYQPALALSSPAVSGDLNNDGLLTMGEILGLRLDADWVVLSACNTGAADGAGAEAFSGLGRAFFYAGTRALLLSNWPVETTSARLLTTDIFRRQANNAAIGRAEAVRQSMLDLLDGKNFVDPASGKIVFSYAHPIFWAPFSLVGDGGGGRPAS